MAQLTIDIPDAQVARVRNKASAYWGYSGTDTAAGKTAFIKAHLAAYLKDAVKQQEAAEAMEAARATADNEVTLS